MKMKMPARLREELLSNKFLRSRFKELKTAKDNNRTTEFLDENPDFVQMVMNYADKVTVEEE